MPGRSDLPAWRRVTPRTGQLLAVDTVVSFSYPTTPKKDIASSRKHDAEPQIRTHAR